VSAQLISLLTIPLFSGAIGYATNWTGVWMLFHPVRFRGITVPGVAPLVHLLPKRIQQIPGLMNGGVGWQGIIPSRAAKMGSISVDKGIAKLGSPAEFYRQLEPERIAQHIIDSARPDMRPLVERIMRREHPALWRDLPPPLRDAVHQRVERELPGIVHGITDEIGENIDHLLNIKLMVIRQLARRPELANRVYQDVGEHELRMIINFGFWFGLVLGIPVALITELALPGQKLWLLPVFGILIGYVTNLMAIKAIFEPVEPRRIGRFTVHGLFLRRQREAADVYARLISDEVVTMRHIGEELMHGPSADRTRRMIEDSLRPALDRAVGPLQPAVRVLVGTREYDAVRESLATEAVAYTMVPMTDEDLNREQKARVFELVSRRTRELASADFAEMLRSAMREDEWLLYLHGGVLGLAGGLLHVLVFA
jgi:uncharacterized membrane protein YheB (UPF0754 family)